jgi:rhodanese-related sulfurtransferase
VSELRNVTVDEFDDLLADGAVLLDVRESTEWDAGHAPGAMHVALADLSDHVAALPRDRAVVCVCRSGGRSARAARYLLESGVDALNLEGGMTAWALAGRALACDGGDPVVL